MAAVTGTRVSAILARVSRRTVVATAAGLLALLLTLGVGTYIWLRQGLPDANALKRMGDMDQATAIFDRSDQLAFTVFKEQRLDVPLSAMSPHLKAAILAIEDQRFYDHAGFDAVRIGAAMLTNLRRGRLAQGGSTITQQLARQSFLSADKTFHRKLQELLLAERIERVYSKDQILELYLNKVYLGDGFYGVEAASRGFFNRHANDLSVSQAALLAGLVKSPSSYAPTVSLERAVSRRNVVLQAMLESKVIDRGTFDSARSEEPVLVDGLKSDEPHGQYFKEQVRRELVERFGWQRVYQGGLRVYTTIDMAMQAAADQAVSDGLKTLEARRTAKRSARARAADVDHGPLQAALIAIEPASGAVRAMTGGRDFAESSFNRAVQAKRQPGSAFKPFVYASAIESGYTPASLITNLNAPIDTPQGGWTPEDEHSTSDSMSIRAALRTSSNRAAVRMLQDVGIAKTVQYAKSLGVGDVPSVPSLALGSGEVTLQSMTAAYAAFANRGVVPAPMLIRRVEDRDGQVLFAATPSGTQAVRETTAFLMTNMMADVINAGTAARARTLGFTLPAAGKTGTTNDYNDAWFVGFTPSLVAGVWVGFDQPQTILPGGFAADVAVPLWASFMKTATRGDKRAWFPVPPGIVTADVCRLSGKLAAEGCEHAEVVDDDGHVERKSVVYREYFVRGTEPTDSCDLHGSRGILGSVAALLTGHNDAKPDVVRAQDLLPAPTLTPYVTPPPAPAPPTSESAREEPRKKRGFWSRIFGRGKDSRD